MAYIKQQNPLDNQTEVTGQTNGIDPNAQTGSGTFTNLQRYLSANQPGAQNLGNSVAGVLDTSNQNAQASIDRATTDFSNSVNAGTNIFNPDAADPSNSQKSTYTGPTSFNNSAPGQDVTANINKANEQAALANNVGGRTQLIQGLSPEDTTRGGLNLDQFLLQNTAPAYNQVATAANNIAPLISKFNDVATNAQSQVTAAQKAVSDKNAALQTLIDNQTANTATAKAAADQAAYDKVLADNAAATKAANDAYLAQLAASNANQQTQFEQQQATANTTNETAYQKMVDLLNSYKAANPDTPVTTTPPPTTTPTDTTVPVVSGLITMADGRKYDPSTGIITGPSSSGTGTDGTISTGTNSGTQGEGGMGPGESVGPGASSSDSGNSSGTGTGGLSGAVADSLGINGLNGLSTTGIGSTIGDSMSGAAVSTGTNTGGTIGGMIGAAVAGPVGAVVGAAIGQAIGNSMATNGQPGAVGPAGPSAAATADGIVGEDAAAADAAATNAANTADSQEGVAANADAAAAAAAAEGMAATSGLDAAGAVSAAPAGDVGLSASTGDNASSSVSVSPGDAPGDSPGSVSVGASEGQTGSVSEGGGEGGGGGGGKIICTAMNDMYGLPYNENKVWIKYAVTHLKPEHQVGYHKVFLPLVDYAYKQGNGWSHLQVRKVLEYIAVNRTIDIQAELAGKYRRPVHKLLRNIIEPVLYWIGRK